jgi:ribosome-associated protein
VTRSDDTYEDDTPDGADRPVPVATVDPTDEDLTWALVAARAADDKLATDTVVIDVGDVLGITGWFVITTGRNTRQVKAIAEAIEADLSEAGGPRPLRSEGRDEFSWVLIDYGGFVVHVFETEARSHYGLDRLWSDRPHVALDPS